ncbi:VirK/YbjX family protein [Duganella sp.]|uniref:VirK/YbjX family protein n=1 Tax=Duganella sp. TaxID=1904440 RepID=UPI0031D914A4
MSQSITIRAGAAGFTGLKHLRERLKLSLRAALHHRATYGWLQLLNSHPMFAELVQARPRLIYKIYRPYLSNTMPCAQRVDVLREHYRHVLRFGLGPLTVRAARAAVPLASIEGKSGLPYRLQLRAIEPMEREGELVLQLLQGSELVYSCAFSFVHSEQGMLLGIGCMQGPRGAHGLQLIKDATRELHGLRPKNLMVKLLSQIAHDHGCVALRLVSNRNRVVCGATRQGKVHADYDGLWQELGALQRADGDYQLASEPICEPDLAAIASKKRSEARKRHETLCELAQAVAVSLHAPRMAAVPALAALPPVPMAEEEEQYALA